MKLTHTHLITAGMPAWDVNKFRLEWPDGCDVTPENYQRALKIGLTPQALFAAICPSKETMDKWYKYFGREADAEIKQLDDELKAKIDVVRKRSAAQEIEHKCQLIRDAMKMMPL